MRTRILVATGVLIASLFIHGCSSETPKSGVPIQQGDYMNAPGGGAKPGSTPAKPGP